MRRLAALVVLWAWLAPSFAATVVHENAVRRQEIAIAEKLRCTVCQAESLAVSQAGIARDMRKLIRQKLRAGETPAQIRGYFVKRYGDYILLKPPSIRWVPFCGYGRSRWPRPSAGWLSR